MSNTILPYYAFLPWVRKGIAKEISKPENLNSTDDKIRTSIAVNLKLIGEGGTTDVFDSANKIINILGPGDITGLNPDAIVRTEPTNNSIDFEPNYLASIEFYDVDFLWRYSPAKAAANKLRPWLFLMVLKEDEFEFEEPIEGQLPSFKVLYNNLPIKPAQAPFLPNASETAYWGHVQLTDSIGHTNPNDLSTNNLDPTNSNDLDTAINNFNTSIKSNENLGISRLISPRKLEEKTNYRAFLVPTYETGRLSGLGKQDLGDSIPAQKAAWGSPHPEDDYENRFPIYFDWSFSTGEKGDFESMVKEIMPRTLDNRIGRKSMDIQDPGFGLTYQLDLEPGPLDELKTTISIEGALKVPGTVSEGYPYLDKENDINYDPAGPPNFRKQLEDLVNINEDLKSTTGITSNYYGQVGNEIGGSTIADDPIIAPPIYGKWQAAKMTVDAEDTSTSDNKPGWLHELNLDPRNRVIANVGSTVIREKQEQYMDIVWGQLGDVLEANKKINWGQLAKQVSKASYDKNIATQPADKVFELTGKIKRRIKNSNNTKTQYQNIQDSVLPFGTEDRSLRRIKRSKGPLMKKVDPSQQINGSSDNLVGKLSTGTLLSAEVKVAPVEALTTPNGMLDSAIQTAMAVNTSTYTFNLANIGQPAAPASNNVQAQQMSNLVSTFDAYFSNLNWAPETPNPNYALANEAADVVTKINPSNTLPERILKNINSNGQPISLANGLNPISAYPKIDKPMYETIKDISPDLLIPNLQYVPSNTVAVLKTNPKFIESFMVGLNHEMSRELLWREFPTDQRGSYFRQFWNTRDNVNSDNLSEEDYKEANYSIKEINEWKDGNNSSKLGDNGINSNGEDLVLLLRANLLKKYPNTLIYAIEADWQRNGTFAQYNLPRVPKAGTEIYPIFSANMEPDISFLGFGITEEEAKGDDPLTLDPHNGSPSTEADAGYFFVLKERIGQSRFGLDVDDPLNTSGMTTWNDLSWGELSTIANESININDLSTSPSNKKISDFDQDISWGSTMNSAEMAMVLFQKPLMVSIHAREMLKSTEI